MMKMRKRIRNRRTERKIAFLLSVSLVLTILSAAGQGTEAAAAQKKLLSPVISKDGTVTWDCVYFGSYPQAEVISASMSREYRAVNSQYRQEEDLVVNDTVYRSLQQAKEEQWNANGDITLNNVKYRRIKKSDATGAVDGKDNYYQWKDEDTYCYFQYQPIKWRVLYIGDKEGTALLVAEKGLDCQRYSAEFRQFYEEWDDEEIPIWKKCSLRSWLNGYSADENIEELDFTDSNFIHTAFSEREEKSIMVTSLVVNGGKTPEKDIKNKIFLLSEEETYEKTELSLSEEYGFSGDYAAHDRARMAKGSMYAKAMGAKWNTDSNYAGNSSWWLWSDGDRQFAGACVRDTGYVNHFGFNVDYTHAMVRPALMLDMGTDTWSSAGTVSAKGAIEEAEDTPTGEPSLPDAGLSNPISVNGITIWDSIYFGSYPQAEVVSEEVAENYEAISKPCIRKKDLIVDTDIYSRLSRATGWDSNGDITLDGVKYRRMQKGDAGMVAMGEGWITEVSEYYQWENENRYHYFQYQPIKWRVLSVEDGVAFLLADQCLDRPKIMMGPGTEQDIVSWMNKSGSASAMNPGTGTQTTGSGFLQCAFTEEEQQYLQISNEESGQKVDLMKASDLAGKEGTKYGFAASETYFDLARMVKGSTYARAMGALYHPGPDYAGNCDWVVRGGYVAISAFVTDDGNDSVGVGTVRPTVRLQLTSDLETKKMRLQSAAGSSVWKYAGKVKSSEVITEPVRENATPSGTPEPSVTPEASATSGTEPTPNVSETPETDTTAEPTLSGNETPKASMTAEATDTPNTTANASATPSAGATPGTGTTPGASESPKPDMSAAPNETSEPTMSGDETPEPTMSGDETPEPTDESGETAEPTAETSGEPETSMSPEETTVPPSETPQASLEPTEPPRTLPTIRPIIVPTLKPRPTLVPIATPTPTSVPTQKPAPTVTPAQNDSDPDDSVDAPQEGTKLKDRILNVVFTVIKQGIAEMGRVWNGEVAYQKADKGAKTIIVPEVYVQGGVTYRITEIGAKACANNKKLKKVMIGANIKKIGKSAFGGCSKLKKVVISSTKITSIGKNAFKGIAKNATIYVPKKKYAKYKKLFKSSTGFKKTMKLKKKG